MRKWQIVALTVAGGAALLALAFIPELVELASRAALQRPMKAAEGRAESSELARSAGRVPLTGELDVPEPAVLPSGFEIPASERELAELVARLRSLGHEELLRLSNAEYGFQESELIDLLQKLEGEWVVPALGGLAVAESDPLLKAILVEGLVAGLSQVRSDDERMLPILDALMTRMGRAAADDPYEVAGGLATFAHMVCLRGGQDYVRLMGEHLANSDNPAFLDQGYLFMAGHPGAEALLQEVLTSHPSSSGRLGAIEGLRQSATQGRIPPDQVTSLALAALETETDEGNRLLIYEMMVSTGGEEALTALEQILRSGQVSEIHRTVGFLAMEMEPARAQALFQDLLRDHELVERDRQALYDAMGLLEGEEGVEFLLGLAEDDDIDPGERLAGLRGLWNRPVDEQLAGELRDVLDGSGSGQLRLEALRMLVYGESEGAGIDLRELAVLDDDPAVRAEAVQLAAMQPSANTREWLEERLFQDRSLDVKAAALGALVYQAHYSGEGDAVLGYLERARRFTNDEEALAMIAEGERMVKDYDPRNLELRLAKEVEFLGTIARYTEGPAARSFQRQARQMEQIVASLRASRDGRRPAR